MRRRSSAAFACIRAGISSEKSSNRRSGIFLLPSPRLRRGGGGGGGAIGIDRCIDCHENARRVLQNVVIPESQNTIAVRFEVSRACLIGRTERMLPAVEFNHESELMTCEVRKAGTDRRLAPKVMFLE